MKILFDQGTPVPLRRQLHGHDVATAFEQGWSHLENGALLDMAEHAGFDVFLTTDQNLRYQQNLQNRRLSLIILRVASWPRIQATVATILEALARSTPGSYEEIEL